MVNLINAKKSLPIVMKCSSPDFAPISGNAKNFHAYIGVNNSTAARLSFWQILATNYLMNNTKNYTVNFSTFNY
jgi:hypothetical protein